MRLVADGVYQLRGFLPTAINVYLVEDVLVDAGYALSRGRILRQLRTRDVRTHVVTHAHPDHIGASHSVCAALDVPLWCGERDAAAVESGRPEGSGTLKPLFEMQRVKGHPVARRLREGDEVAGFTVLDVPGHSPGHIALWRETDRTLVAGDVFFNIDVRTGLPRLRHPPGLLTVDPERNRESMRRVAELEPALALFGHGPPLRDPRRIAEVAR